MTQLLRDRNALINSNVMTSFLVILKEGAGNQFYVVDGNHRLHALKKHNYLYDSVEFSYIEILIC